MPLGLPPGLASGGSFRPFRRTIAGLLRNELRKCLDFPKHAGEHGHNFRTAQIGKGRRRLRTTQRISRSVSENSRNMRLPTALILLKHHQAI